jgi:hypothetical protein
MTMRTTTQMRVLVISIVAVVVCGIIIGVLQYRSLVQLETRTRITFQDDLARSAQSIARDVEGDVRTIGTAALASFNSEDISQSVNDLGRRFRAIQREHSEVDEVFLFAFDDPSGTLAVFSTQAGADRCT